MIARMARRRATIEVSDLDRLHKLRVQFGSRWRQQKRRLLESTMPVALSNARALRQYHETLLFMRAYPDDRDMLRIVESKLEQVAKAAHTLDVSGDRRLIHALDDSGIANTVNRCAFSYDGTDWLANRFPHDVNIAWDQESEKEPLGKVLDLLVERVEVDGLFDDSLTTQSWLELAKGESAASDLAWLIERMGRWNASSPIRDRLFESLDFQIEWRLRDRDASRTFVRFPSRPVYYQTENLTRAVSLPQLLKRKISNVRHCSRAEAETLIDVARTTLAVRHRETDPVTYANPKEITLIRLEGGVDVATFGATPDRRLPIESFFGYILARNRVPVGYGGGWVFFDRCEIGVNIFDTYRGGENSLMFAQVMRVFHQHYRATRFVVDPFQFGAENAEAIKSGAFWFYYRMGFRPSAPRLLELAQSEWKQLRDDPTYRTPAATLRRLAHSSLELKLGTEDAAPVPEPKQLGMAVTRWINNEFDGHRDIARERARASVRRWLGVQSDAGWRENEREAFDRLCLLAAMLPEIKSWRPMAKRNLVTAFKAKGGPQERKYALGLQRHTQFRKALGSISTIRPDPPNETHV